MLLIPVADLEILTVVPGGKKSWLAAIRLIRPISQIRRISPTTAANNQSLAPSP
jgi:hypothetical protein